MKKLHVWIVLLVLVCLIIPLEADASENGIGFTIRFFDRRVYRVGYDPIFIQVTITNDSPSVYRFRLADDRIFSIDFDVRTASNRPLEASDQLIRRRTQSQQVFSREISVAPGESFSFVEDLRSYIHINESGSFVVSARMHPELIRTAAGTSISALESNRLNLSVRPQVTMGPDGIPLEMDIATGAVLVRERLAPDLVVDYMLTARQRSQWERFFLYLDLEAMLLRDAVRQRSYLAESEEGRRRMIDVFREELRNDRTDDSIAVIPTEFEIERTQYTNSQGTVTVLQRFRSNNFTELKRYTYHLRLRDNIWTIVDYSVNNLGTE